MAANKSMSMVSGTAKTNDVILDLSSKKSQDVPNIAKDKIYEIDCYVNENMQNSNNQNRILVHWAMGMSRSATMVIMYLMRKFQIEWSLAFDIVKARRDIIDPNEGFIQKLKNYEGKQYKIKRTDTVISGDEIVEANEENSSFSHSSSSEDLMERKYSIDI